MIEWLIVLPWLVVSPWLIRKGTLEGIAAVIREAANGYATVLKAQSDRKLADRRSAMSGRLSNRAADGEVDDKDQIDAFKREGRIPQQTSQLFVEVEQGLRANFDSQPE
ncbi:hypothetical protein DAH66_18475 [Sphingomonas koreensis]|uniref:Uncharacterized protein n=1 Tax=Sphingomonas koreensis TaxID=93064 RepID=A0A2M8WAJ4_9SPHN|nr:hypothetical protein [Sphingomonas koreensis]PJI87937.1 hypothetical protein BDW16_1197 [Sphingomonas koreensis]RSU56403.1 hypothetical protein DAH56_19040 [Sphingomonas koreensis]RSU66112.1 hypothetical protein DAH55_16000 [Sphingomonas koreensis]RSY78537.1 hypothetical protein DAH66_18475 [Sphingomonas koreensis]